jgi:hypothetical protein
VVSTPCTTGASVAEGFGAQPVNTNVKTVSIETKTKIFFISSPLNVY